MDSKTKHKAPLILVTGASTGLGLAITKKLISAQKYRLVLTARESSLYRFGEQGIFEGPDIFIRALEVTDADQRQALVSECENSWGGIDVLINNAGTSLRSVVEHTSAEDQMRQIEVNYVAPMRLISLVLPHMRAKRSGKIINVSSAAGLMGMPTMACYCGSKFALEGATEALWYEVRPWNINVSLVIPGFVRSESYKKRQPTQQSLKAIWSGGKDPYYRHYSCMDRLISFMMRRTTETPERIAKKVLRVVEHPSPSLRVPVTFDACLLYLFKRFVPRALYHSLMFKALPDSESWGRRKLAKSPVEFGS